MVGRLVEQQQVGLGEQDRGQAPPASATRRTDRRAAGAASRRRSRARRGCARRGRAPNGRRSRPAGSRSRRRAVAPARLRARPAGAVRSRSAASTVSCGVAAPLGASWARNPTPAAARQVDRAVLRLQDAADQVEQGGFADAVAADQPDLGAFRDLGIRPVEQCPTPVDAVGHFKKGQHRGLIPRGYSRARLCRFDLSGRAWTAAEVLLGQQPARRAGGSAAAPAVRSGSCRRSPASR